MKSNLLLKLLAVSVVTVSCAQLSFGDSLEAFPDHGSKFVRHLGYWPNRRPHQKIIPRSWAPTVKNLLSNNTRALESSDSSVSCNCDTFIYTFGGSDKFYRQVASVSRLDTTTGKWTSLGRMLIARAYAGVAKIGNKAYIVGGRSNEHNYLSSAEVYDLSTQTSSFVRSMPDSRYWAPAAELNGFVYVAGGWNATYGRLSSVLRYDPSNDTWEYVKKMRFDRVGHQLVALGGRLYVIDGDALPASASNIVESYDPATDEWTMVESTRTIHYTVGATVGNGKIYACSDRGCESYDPNTDRWQIIAKPSPALWGTNLAFANNKLWSLGGSVSYGAGGKMELHSYNLQTGEWTKESDMDLERVNQVSVPNNQ